MAGDPWLTGDCQSNSDGQGPLSHGHFQTGSKPVSHIGGVEH